MFETGDFQTPAPPESGVAGNAVASTPQDHWLYNELVDGFHIDRVVRDYNYSMDIRHIHEEYEIYYLLEGERYYFINQQTYLSPRERWSSLTRSRSTAPVWLPPDHITTGSF